ncbi:hypothetical protein CDAR_280291 [Caerostris darwini]|uniref:Uncharacterized protein n=1 Tax=Caerostris darwini TaxID=1538125 RepID=A0AAV4SCM4_9ARAC|nr:hypothetical protein CDAR_280291 [Caerostris darwini]
MAPLVPDSRRKSLDVTDFPLPTPYINNFSGIPTFHNSPPKKIRGRRRSRGESQEITRKRFGNALMQISTYRPLFLAEGCTSGLSPGCLSTS